MTLRKTLLSVLVPMGLAAAMPALAGELAYPCGDIAERAKLSGFGTAVYQGDDGWFFRSNEIEHAFPMSPRAATFLMRLNAVLEAKGVRLVLMPLPYKAMLAPKHAEAAAVASNVVFDPAYARQEFDTLRHSIEALGISVVDLLAETDQLQPGTDLFFAQDLHWRPELAKLAAQASAKTIGAAFPGEFPAGKSFATRAKTAEPEIHRANSRLFLNQLCQSAIPAEMMSLYETVETDQSVDAFLGDDTAAPPISLIGTSFTDEAQEYNFAGFLREALQADVASYSISGGNIDSALFKWAHNGEAGSGTRVLLWEIPYIDRLEAAATPLERTVVPAIAGSCVGTGNEVFGADYTLSDRAPFTLPVPADVSVSGDDYYVAMQLSDAAARGFTFTFDYRDGKRDVLPVVREARVGAIDHVYAELAPDLRSELGAISFRAMQPGTNAGHVALCRYPTAMPQSAQNGGTGGAVVLTTGQEVKK